MIEQAVAIARLLIAHFEGFYSLPYLCPAHVPTIGYGFTYYRDGRPVTLLDPAMSRADADEYLEYLIRTKYMRSVLVLCSTLDTPERLGAIVDFCFNLGAVNLRNSTLRQKILAEQWAAVPLQFYRWNKAGGRVLPGLTKRRATEAAYI